MAWIRDAVGLSLSAAALAVVSILATRFARPLVWFPHSPRGLQVDMAWIGDSVGMSLSAAALAVVSILAIYFACPLLVPHPSLTKILAIFGKRKRKRNDDEEGDIDYILKALNGFQAYFSSAPTPSRINASKKFDLLKLNDDVYELCKPSGRPSVEIVFFHGFQLGGSRQTYATTWLSRNGSELWPNWIKKSVPEVRILLVSYDGSATKKADRGGTDMYVTSENLVQSLTSNAAHVGQDGCPVILVGHSLGGLVIKEILLQANKVLSFDKPENPNWPVRDFLENVKQLFYYSCPHDGIRLADDKRMSRKGELFELLTTLNKKAARRNDEFRKLRERYKWGASSIAEKLPADLGSLGKQVVVEEASDRLDTDYYYTADADHFRVCQPASDIDSSFGKLMEIIDYAKREVVRGHQIETPTTVGLDYQITQVTRTLRTTRYLSICGIGGIGKSTLAKAVYNAISGNFEYTSFVSEVKTKLVGKEVSTENLQEEILKNLYYKGNKSEHKWDRLIGKRVFIVLDDVENESQVFVMPKTDGGVGFFSDESCVLVTCRNRSIVSSKDFAVHNAGFLGKADSRKLFCSHAFKKDNAPGPYEDYVEKFVGKCEGFPLALEVAGKFLYTQKDKAMWNGAFQSLSAAQSLGGSKKEDRLWSIFEVIYEDLGKQEEQMFLDIATCFHGDKKKTANLVWRCCDWVISADVGWKNLVDIGFVRVSGWLKDTIWMHELLRDFGRRKANPGSMENYSRVCCYPDSNGLPPWPFKEGTTPLVKFLRIAAPLTNKLHIDIERLGGLENLKVLLLEGVMVYGAFNLLPDNLEVLIMRECGWTPRSSKSVSEAKDHYYIPRDGWCSTLGESSASKSGQHVSLRYIEFRECHHFVPEQSPFPDPLFPDQSIEHLPALKYLRIDLQDIDGFLDSILEGDPLCALSLPDSLGQLQSLGELDISYILTHLFESLGELDIRWNSLTHLPESLGELDIRWNSLTHLPESLGQLRTVQKLALNCEALTRLPESVGQLQSLRELAIHSFILTRLPESLGQLRSLQKLALNCEALTRLPESVGQLQSLRELAIHSFILKRLPDSLGQLQSLRELAIGCFSLTHLPDSLKQLQSLQKLAINCGSLTALPDTLGQLGGLRKLSIEYCDGLRALPDTLGQLGGLRELKIEGCDDLTALPDTLGQLGGLRELKIARCDDLTALPDTLGQLGGLRKLSIEYCDGLRALPDTLGQLGGLRELKIEGCDDLTALPDTLGHLGGLRELSIEHCNGLTALPDNLGHLGGLQRLVIKECESLETLPDALGDLHALQYLDVSRC